MKKAKVIICFLVVVLLITNWERLDSGYKKLTTAFRGNVTVDDLYTYEELGADEKSGADENTAASIDRNTITETGTVEQPLEKDTENTKNIQNIQNTQEETNAVETVAESSAAEKTPKAQTEPETRKEAEIQKEPETQRKPEKTTAYYDSYGVKLSGGYSIGESTESGFSVQDSDGTIVAEVYVEWNRGGSPTYNEAMETYNMVEMPNEKEFIYRDVAYTDNGRAVTCILSFEYCATIYDDSGADLYWNEIMDFDVN